MAIELPFLVCWGNSILFSIMTAPVYIPTSSVGGFPFLHNLSSIFWRHFNDGHSEQCEVVLHCSFEYPILLKFLILFSQQLNQYLYQYLAPENVANMFCSMPISPSSNCSLPSLQTDTINLFQTVHPQQLCSHTVLADRISTASTFFQEQRCGFTLIASSSKDIHLMYI